MLVGYLADVDFGSETLRFLGAARFDVYGMYKLCHPNPVTVKEFATNPANQGQIGPGDFLSITYQLLPMLTPTFHFEGPGFSLLKKQESLFKWLLQSKRKVSPPVEAFKIGLTKESAISIDGERYKASEIHAEKLPSARIFRFS